MLLIIYSQLCDGSTILIVKFCVYCKLGKFYLTKPHDSVVDGEEKKV